MNNYSVVYMVFWYVMQEAELYKANMHRSVIGVYTNFLWYKPKHFTYGLVCACTELPSTRDLSLMQKVGGPFD